jgi:quaternary ammonium compound-resistance protein SugE
MPWLYLAITAVLEAGLSFGAAASKGFTRFWPSVLTTFCSAAGIYFFGLALLGMDIAVGYTILAGSGSVAAILIGVAFFGERLTISRAACLAVIILGIVGLRVTSGA